VGIVSFGVRGSDLGRLSGSRRSCSTATALVYGDVDTPRWVAAAGHRRRGDGRALIIGTILAPLLLAGPAFAEQAEGGSVSTSDPGPAIWRAGYWPTVVLLAHARDRWLYRIAVPRGQRWWRDLPGAAAATGVWLARQRGPAALRCVADRDRQRLRPARGPDRRAAVAVAHGARGAARCGTEREPGPDRRCRAGRVPRSPQAASLPTSPRWCRRHIEGEPGTTLGRRPTSSVPPWLPTTSAASANPSPRPRVLTRCDSSPPR
jgi:hypothetical protein